MLFRPLTEKRIGGIRIPFTPGILPRERGKLADSIGRMVERELLTEEILKERIALPLFREKIKKTVSDSTEKLFRLPMTEWGFSRSPTLLDLLRAVSETAYPKAAEALVSFLNREDIKRVLEDQGRLIVTGAILNLNVIQRLVISAAQYDKTLDEKMPDMVTDLIDRLAERLEDESVKKQILELLGKEMLSFSQKNGRASLSELVVFGEEKKDLLDGFISGAVLSAAEDRIGSVLESIDIKNMVSTRINSLDMLRVERLILDIMAGQLHWIDIFGGILGAFIGLVQAALNHLVF
jgi:uncharacterized membrane protein YheB (UPF0754 family)